MSKVLVVEDDLTQSTYVTAALRQQGIEVVTANTADAAKAAVQNQTFDLIWLDVILPDGNGYSLCRYFKKTASTRNIPVIIYTSKGSEIDQEWGVQQGAAAYLVKPAEVETIVQTVRQFLPSLG
jgi:two-component system, chemotaxis family, response regulator PixH